MPTDVESLTEMGFDENRARKALAKSGYKGVMAAIEWLSAHQDDPDIDEPFEMPKGHSLTAEPEAEEGEGDKTTGEGGEPGAAAAEAEAKSFKCDDCGKLLGTGANVEMHAARTGHANFSESTEEIKPLTEEEKKEQAAKIQEKLNQKRAERVKKEQEEALQKEKVRRKQGKDYTGVKQKMAEDEMKKIAEERRREKIAEKAARQKVKEQIEKDKANRAKLFPAQGSKKEPEPEPMVTSPAPTTAPTVKAPPKEYNETKLQIRLASGQPITETFSVNEPLASVRLLIQRRQEREYDAPYFTFMTTFPRKVFTEDEMQASLKGLGLVPSAVLMIKDL